MGAAAVAQLAGRVANVLAVDIDGEGLAEVATQLKDELRRRPPRRRLDCACRRFLLLSGTADSFAPKPAWLYKFADGYTCCL
jgi:hypothetical protein